MRRAREERGGGGEGKEKATTKSTQTKGPTKHLDNLLASLESIARGIVGPIAVYRARGGIVGRIPAGRTTAVGGMGAAVGIGVAAWTHAVAGGINVHRFPVVCVLVRGVLAVWRSELVGGHARRR